MIAPEERDGSKGSQKVAIIIPTYNTGAYLDQTIASVIAQSHQDWELIVVDDGSKDGTPEKVEACATQDTRIRLIRQQNGGVANARNRGVSEVSPDAVFVIFLDHDDFWLPDALSLMLAPLNDANDFLAAHGLSQLVDGKGKTTAGTRWESWQRERRGLRDGLLETWSPEEPTTLAVEVFRNRILTMGQILFRKSALMNIGPLDPDTVPCDDYDLYLRLLQHGDFAFVNEFVICWRRHESNTSGDDDRMMKAEEVARSKAQNAAPDPAHRELAREGLRHVYLDMISDRASWAEVALKKGHVIDALKQWRHMLKERRMLKSVGMER